MSQSQNDNRNRASGSEPLGLKSGGGGRQRQGIGEAFMMSMIRQIARSIGALLVRMVTGGGRRR